MTETTTLRDAALAAAHDSARKAREQRATERDNHLTQLLAEWDTRAALSYKGDTLPRPDRDAFTWTPYPGFNYGYPGCRTPNVHGWTWETDGITFVYDASYDGQGLCVVLTCPDCGERHADHAYGLDGLGKLLRAGRASGHQCREVALRALAYAIREASEQTGLPPATIAAEAADRNEAYPRR